MNLYDISVKTQDNKDYSLSNLKGKVLLIVNTATGCGFTPQYKELEELYEKYNKDGFEILDFPCNQFANQAPLNDQEINEFCTLNYNTSFKRFKKIEVNGENEDKLFTFLKKEKRGIGKSDIKWNFTKFLVNKEGKVIKRYAPTVTPLKIEKDIKGLLNE